MFTHVNVPTFKELTTKTINGLRWYKTPEGNYYPSITSILGAKEKPYLESWRQMLGPDKAQKETDRCAARGTAIHLMAEKYLNNEIDPTEGQPTEYIKLFNQLKYGLKRIDNIRIQEIPLYSDEFMIAGRVDCIAEFDGVLSVIDFKTSNNNKDDKMIEDYFLQETFYALAYMERYGDEVNQIVTIAAVERGAVPLVFKKTITPYIIPLKRRVDEFYTKYVK
jgi:ATP-dependent exoDNAse (exonuclease V) beta subunit